MTDKINRSERNKPIEQDAAVRAKNFDEVSQGFNESLMLSEADRCLNCPTAPCMNGCPVAVKIPEFIAALKDNNPMLAAEIIKGTNSLPAVCGRVCPQEKQCEKYCVRNRLGGAVAIGNLERYAADYALNRGEKGAKPDVRKKGYKVAAIGSGPASLTLAGDLAKAGVDVTIYEAFHKAGGVLSYGIPEFRLPKSIVRKEIEKLEETGVKIVTNAVIGKTITVSELLEDFDAVFIGSGAGLPKFMGIRGENLIGVYSANEYLTRVNLMGAYKKDSDTPIVVGNKVAVIGAGNVAMDAARTALRLGSSEVTIVYRRGREEMPARAEEISHAEEEGVRMLLLHNPVEILGEKKVEGIRLEKMQLGEADSSGRRSPKGTGEFLTLDVDQVIIALGTSPNPLLAKNVEGLGTTEKGTVIADDRGATTLKRVYAGGDAVTGAATVILAMGAGKRAAQSILEDICI